MKNDTIVKCPDCSGTGFYWYDLDGYGKLETNYDDCTRCDGTGTILFSELSDDEKELAIEPKDDKTTAERGME